MDPLPSKWTHYPALYALKFCEDPLHSTLRMTPAMAAGVTDRLWEMSDVVALLDTREKREQAEREENQLSTKGSALGFDPIPKKTNG